LGILAVSISCSKISFEGAVEFGFKGVTERLVEGAELGLEMVAILLDDEVKGDDRLRLISILGPVVGKQSVFC